ncbi:surface antigen (D15) [Fluviicola taffensis]|uniref:Surface antigen (D15) n=1 Tax=Fluviicola taffensis (strain DSM 16823 / NCIMB 13979 / RW262) TaxID=755732 RepID=F2IJG6_FLUTR|nr:surface antigen (D15) [Fluviicola taffensis]AEA42854.1 surface antigen (D15) [Fluviicola taffensis DSM 16823]
MKHFTRFIEGKWWIGILFLLLFLVSPSIYSQKTIYFSDPAFKKISKKKEFLFSDSISLNNQLKEIQFLAYKKGYLTFGIDSITSTDSLHKEAHFTLGLPYKKLILEISDKSKRALREIGISPRTIETLDPNPAEITRNLERILHQFEIAGYPFAKLSFEDLRVEKETLYADLLITTNSRVKWNELVVKGTKVKLSAKYLENFLHIESGDWYNQEQVDLITTRLTQLTFVKQTKPAEILFTPEGANLYLYIETKPVSLFNGTIGLQQDPIKLKYQITGDIRLKLQNAFKHGELFDLNWRSIQPGTQQLKIQAAYPFLFNTPFGLDGQFSLFKRDSTFLELKTTAGVTYFVSGGKTLTAFYKNQQSNLLGAATTGLYGTTKSNSYGLSFRNQTVDYLPNPRKGFVLYFEANIGKRTLQKDTIRSSYLLYGGKLQFEYYQSLGKRFVIKAGIISETFYTNNIQQNELLRFGGNLSQRGFLEDELLSTYRATFTIEPRFILDQNSYLFAFYDQSWYESNVQNYVNDSPKGFGAGLCFGTNIGIFSLTYALGHQFSNPILFRDSKVHFGYVAYF